jgi:hypothetical protein
MVAAYFAVTSYAWADCTKQRKMAEGIAISPTETRTSRIQGHHRLYPELLQSHMLLSNGIHKQIKYNIQQHRYTECLLTEQITFRIRKFYFCHEIGTKK